jgi:hypothetical protein
MAQIARPIAGLLAAAVLICTPLSAGHRARTPIAIPDLPGFVTLKCDLHIHTVFSDGKVWPDVRVDEAWIEGLDAIAITDHLEYLPHRADLPVNHNRAYEIAAARGEMLGIIVIKGTEITREMPPGHWNAIFIDDANPIDTSPHLPLEERTDWRAAMDAAAAQDSFIFWNHPGWIRQAPGGVARWYLEHDEILASGMMHGIEVVNDDHYYPEAHQWCIDHDLAMLGNSDIHPPVGMHYALHAGARRPLTLVFAREASPAGIREALFARRTAVYSANRLIGDERFLRPIYDASLRLPQSDIPARGGRAVLQIHNHSAISFELERTDAPGDLEIPDRIVLHAGKTTQINLRAPGLASGRHPQRPRYRVTNLLIRPNEGMEVDMPFTVAVE